jgi:hypothetical protein
MKELVIERQEFTKDSTIGSAYFNGDFICYTLERSYLDNKPFVSCIEEDEYELVPHVSKKFGETYALVNKNIGVTHYQESDSVRYAILIHAANSPNELAGCIACGTRKDTDRVYNSRQAVKDLLDIIRTNDIKTVKIV